MGPERSLLSKVKNGRSPSAGGAMAPLLLRLFGVLVRFVHVQAMDTETVQPVPGENTESISTVAETVGTPMGAQQTKSFSRRPSIYFFLQNTMQEFPYAWWYKCITLHSAKILSKGEGVHCSEWRVDLILEHEVLEQTSIYNEPDVRGMLLRINGGVTSAVLPSCLPVSRCACWQCPLEQPQYHSS
jgi:hypothetical protein